jgi:hypothetical protein
MAIASVRQHHWRRESVRDFESSSLLLVLPHVGGSGVFARRSFGSCLGLSGFKFRNPNFKNLGPRLSNAARLLGGGKSVGGNNWTALISDNLVEIGSVRQWASPEYRGERVHKGVSSNCYKRPALLPVMFCATPDLRSISERRDRRAKVLYFSRAKEMKGSRIRRWDSSRARRKFAKPAPGHV